MKLLNIEIHNFNSHKKTEINFEELHFVSFVGDNGSGKSSVIESIMFALFGDNRYKIDSIVRHGESEAKVKVTFMVNDQVCEVTRVRELKKKTGVSKLFVAINDEFIGDTNGGLETNQKIINDLIGFSHSMLRRTVFAIEGDESNFMSLTPSDRKDFIIDILNISEYENYLENAKNKTKILEEEKVLLEKKIYALEQHIEKREGIEVTLEENRKESESLNKELKELEEIQKNFDSWNLHKENHELLIKEYESYISDLNSKNMNISRLKEKIKELRRDLPSKVDDRDLEDLETGLEIFEEERKELESHLENLEKEFNAVSKEFNIIESEFKILSQKLSTLEENSEGECDVCGSELTEEHGEALLNKTNIKKKALDKAQNNLNRAEENFRSAEKDLANSLERIRKSQKRISELHNQSVSIAHTKTQIELLENEMKLIEEAISGLKVVNKPQDFDLESPEDNSQKIKEVEKLLNKLDGETSQLDLSLKETSDSIEKTKALEDEKLELNKQIEIFAVIAEACRRDGIPSLILHSIAKTFESNINYALELITNGLYSSEIEYNQGFQISFKIKGNYVHYESASLGEKTRINLAVRVALYMLVKMTSGKTMETFIIDEGIGALDNEGLNSVMGALTKLNSEFPLVVLIAHQEVAFESSPQSMSVVKNNGTSTISPIRL